MDKQLEDLTNEYIENIKKLYNIREYKAIIYEKQEPDVIVMNIKILNKIK